MKEATDIIQLNVGGKLYTSCISTLTQYSPYFEAMFSQHWNHHHHETRPNENDQVRVVFIDKDPEPFGYLLSYMREGYIDIPSADYSLAKRIILQAQYFGLENFVNHVKITAWKFGGGILPGCICEKNEALEAFDRKYENNLHDAFDDGFLPAAYFDAYDDQFCLRVGNREFHMNKATLINHSEYLRRKICSSFCKNSCFLDQDPNAFEYLVIYMRYSQMDLPRDDPFLFRRVLHIALDIEMKEFLVLVKARTMVNIERHEAPQGLEVNRFAQDCPFGFPVIVSDVHYLYASHFDRRFQGLDRAFSTKVLPARFFGCERYRTDT